MVCNSCTSGSATAKRDSRWRRALWIAFAVNATMFVVEIVSEIAGGSRALQAHALALLGAYVFLSTLWATSHGALPHAEIMGAVGLWGGMQIMRQAHRELDVSAEPEAGSTGRYNRHSV